MTAFNSAWHLVILLLLSLLLLREVEALGVNAPYSEEFGVFEA